MSGNSYAIGIDLGTTFSCVGVWKDGSVQTICDKYNNETFPSAVAFTETHRLFGAEAMNQMSQNQSNTVYDAKRLVGRRFSDSFVEKNISHWPFEVVPDGDDKAMIAVNYMGERKKFYPEEISAMVITRMKDTAEAFLESTVSNAVVTVPAYFNASQRQSTMDACSIAGLKVLRLINEPTAAAMAYGLKHESISVKNVLVVDLGGGTLDVSLVSMDNNSFTVKSTYGNQSLGGQDFTNNMVEHLIKEFENKNRKCDLKRSPKVIRRLKTACEEAKKVLSTAEKAEIHLDTLCNGIDLQTSISRDQFERINSVHFADCMKTVEKCLTYAKTKIKEVDDIVLVGGSTRIPKIESLLTKLFKGKQILKTINRDVAVAHGAAYYAAVLNGDQNVPTAYLNEVTPLNLGYNTSVKDEDSGRIMKDMMAVVVPRCSPLPISKEVKNITTVQDNQNEMCFSIYEGDGQSVNRNTKLGELELLGIPPAKRGVPTITLRFEISSDGALTISATESSSGVNKKITIKNFKGRFSEEEIEKMINQAAKYKSDDEKHQKNEEAAHKLIEYATNMKQTINPKLSVNAKEEIESQINLAVEWLENCHFEDIEDIELKRKDLDKMYHSHAVMGEDGPTIGSEIGGELETE